jgi:hypothetical protein
MRCRNCGELSHKTHECQIYGPWYPEPGVAPTFYAAEKLRIDTLVAGDILAEHEADHEGVDPL